ncbi:hypothetical protein KDW_29720 [Dictyobacter vulcani]|uniref:Uncharacterized protein n=1 Tax=Dictyobacter vulcani TaxID=2607529 RepID=A0A5J4KQU2_9CHLR|nr:hypothetical protein [Dictyobacter vulcani]GER88810.1 hypothetical protein KDW_29720 [Dictyobacter vulcani]
MSNFILSYSQIIPFIIAIFIGAGIFAIFPLISFEKTRTAHRVDRTSVILGFTAIIVGVLIFVYALLILASSGFVVKTLIYTVIVSVTMIWLTKRYRSS